MTENQHQDISVTAEIENSRGDRLTVEGDPEGACLAIDPSAESGYVWCPDDRRQALEVAAAIIGADLAAHPAESPDDRELALAALRGWISDQLDSADDARVGAFYVGQYEADGTRPVVNFECLPVENKRHWRRKFRAAQKSVQSTTPSTQEA